MDHDVRSLFGSVAETAADYVASLSERPVGATYGAEELARRVPRAMPAHPLPARDVVDELVRACEGGLVATGSPRYFGFVIGGALPATIAADWLTSTWDQNAGLHVAGPAAAMLEDTAGRWLLEVLDLPRSASFAMVTGCQMAHVTCLAAARHHVLAERGWDVEHDGLIGAPAVRILAGANVHVTVPRALRLLGFGAGLIEHVGLDAAGRMRPDLLAEALAAGEGRPTIVCAQLGDVNTGAMDPVGPVIDVAHRAGAWVHVDGAFGLWARASERRRELTEGVERADSWATDAHKWLNVPYDCGLAFCAHPGSHRAALGVHAHYLVHDGDGRRDAMDWTPEFSRRARGTVVYAALRALGRDGVAELVDRCCDLTEQVATALAGRDGIEVLISPALNQLLVSFVDDQRTTAVVDRLQHDGVLWAGTTTWNGRVAMRLSIVNWQTSPDDIDRAIDAIVAAASTSTQRTTKERVMS
jgi:glutamate/tyrosine decarboxylase-like PLP-dependent enzyme